jgi:hypothetical protein
MALTRTTISAAIAADADIIPVTSATGFAAGNFLRVDNEYMMVVAVNGTNIQVRSRGDLGSAAAAHNSLAPATTGLLSDLPNYPLGQAAQVDAQGQTIVTASVDGALAIPTQDTLVLVQKAGVCAMTLANPTTAQDGLQVTILSATANAHTVTYTAGFYGDTTSSDVATFAAKVGASFTIKAQGGKWGIVSLANVTLG